MKRGVIYDVATGEITNFFSVPTQADFDAQPFQNEAALQTDDRIDGNAYYVDLSGPTIKERQPISPTISIVTGEATLSGLPDPVTIKWNGQKAEATGGTATVQFGEPGTYKLSLEADVSYLETEIEVTIP